MHPFIQQYTTVALPKLKELNTYASSYQIPKVTKVSVNAGIGDIATNGKAVDDVTNLLTQITGQKPIATKARIAIAGFKIRQNMIVGLKVTLRGVRMNDFLMKLSEIGLPRTRDFRGIPVTSITADGNLNIGLKDSMIFPEATEGVTHSLQVTIVSSAKTMEEARALYEGLGFVFTEEQVQKKKTGKGRNYKKK
jgi:large subunit ribosomal protein L5